MSLTELFAHDFMLYALAAVVLLMPVFGMLGTVVVSGRMAFLSDAIGHSAFTGVAVGAIFGIVFPTLSAAAFSVLFAVGITYMKRHSGESADTVIGVFSSAAVALGIVLLSLNGGLANYSTLLTGNILAIGPYELLGIAVLLVCTIIFWALLFDKLVVTSVSPSLARSRGTNTVLTETLFAALVAVVVTVSVRWVGLLIINSMLVLPAGAARNAARNLREYNVLSIFFALFSGVTGLILSFLLNCATGAMIALVAAGLYLLAYILRGRRRVTG